MTKTAVLFDLDGVIINTEEQYTEFWTVIGKTYLPENPDFPSQIKGHTLTQILSAYFADEAIARQVVEQLNDFETRMSYPYVEGAIDFVSELRKAGIPIWPLLPVQIKPKWNACISSILNFLNFLIVSLRQRMRVAQSQLPIATSMPRKP